jgi:hypothetical protein
MKRIEVQRFAFSDITTPARRKKQTDAVLTRERERRHVAKFG